MSDKALEPVISVTDFEVLLRTSNTELSAYLQDVEVGVELDGTKACTSCHFLKLSPNGHVRFKDFATFLATKVVEFSLPRSEIDAAQEHYQKTNSLTKVYALHKKAISLFSALEKSGEGGEILLYILIEEILKVPQLLCKMNLKTSGEMHVHGCDGIHATYDEKEDLLALYWGESKLYKNLNDGLNECFSSLKNFLTDDGGSNSAQERDLQLIRSYIDIPDERVENAIVSFLDKDSDKFNKVVYRGACLVGFDYKKYPSGPGSSATIDSLKAEVEKEIAKWKKSISKKIEGIADLKSFDLQIFLIPFPSVQSFRDAFFSELGIKKSNDSTK